MATVEELQRQLETLQKQVERQNDIYEIQKVMAAYEYLHYPITFPEKVKLFALEMPDVSMDVGDSGAFVGREGIETVFLKILGSARFAKDAFFFHSIASPYIEVAADGKTAKAVFMSPGLETYYAHHGHVPAPGETKLTAYWCWGKYSADFIKLDGVWKIWHLKWWRDLRCDYYKSWVDDTEGFGDKASYQKRQDVQQEMPFHKPMKFHQPYHTGERKVPLPRLPQPYESFEENGDLWPFRDYENLIGKTEYDIEDRVW